MTGSINLQHPLVWCGSLFLFTKFYMVKIGKNNLLIFYTYIYQFWIKDTNISQLVANHIVTHHKSNNDVLLYYFIRKIISSIPPLSRVSCVLPVTGNVSYQKSNIQIVF